MNIISVAYCLKYTFKVVGIVQIEECYSHIYLFIHSFIVLFVYVCLLVCLFIYLTLHLTHCCEYLYRSQILFFKEK